MAESAASFTEAFPAVRATEYCLNYDDSCLPLQQAPTDTCWRCAPHERVTWSGDRTPRLV